jgi:AcrR family transcriptional regulator
MATKTKAKSKSTAAPLKKKRAYHHGDLRAALVDAARKELHAVGWQELSLRSVARRAGVTHTAAYHHFKDKHALLAQIAMEGFALLDKRMAEAMDAAGPDASPIERLIESGGGYLRMAQEDPQAYDLMFNGLQFDRGDPQVFHQTAKSPFERLVAAVAAARAQSGRTRGELLIDALVTWEVVHGAAMLMRAGHFERMNIPREGHWRYIGDVLRGMYTPG